ncbi:hypothetical protein PZE06_18585 [Robertmurraya sp. DFI.2.37]|jgi:hypothetical protein|nr:hypothetical protein [Robertmurraya sp. DFI.2.37]MDF1510145.1 hypothetical protein [Robertmurraya sp. DFI.2.37]
MAWFKLKADNACCDVKIEEVDSSCCENKEETNGCCDEEGRA